MDSTRSRTWMMVEKKSQKPSSSLWDEQLHMARTNGLSVEKGESSSRFVEISEWKVPIGVDW